MQKITLEKIGLTKLSNAMYGAFMEAFAGLIRDFGQETLGIKQEEFKAFEKTLERMVDALGQLRKNEKTDSLQELDRQRDQLLTYLFAKILTESYAPEEHLQQAGEKLLELRKCYIDVSRKPLREETALIEGLLLDLEHEPTKSFITTLGLTFAVKQLKSLNSSFQEGLLERMNDQIEHPWLMSKAIRAELTAQYDFLSQKVYALWMIQKSEATEHFILQLNQLISDIQLAWKQHKAHSKSAEQGELLAEGTEQSQEIKE